MERSSTFGVSVSLLLLLKSRLILRILSWLTSRCFDPVLVGDQDVRRLFVRVKWHHRFFSKDWREKMLSQFRLARGRTSNVPWWCGLMAQQNYSHLPAFNSHSMRLASVSIHLSVKWLPRGPPVSIHCCINHQSSYGCSTGGYYIMPIAANALQQACLVRFLPPACSSAVLRASSLNPGPVPAGGGRLWPQTAAASLPLSLWRPVSDRNIHITRLHGNRWGHMKQPVTYVVVVRTWTRRQDIEIMCNPGCFELWARLLTLLLFADLSTVFIMKSLLLWQKRPKLS